MGGMEGDVSVSSGSRAYLVESRHLSECSESDLQAAPSSPPESGVGGVGTAQAFQKV